MKMDTVRARRLLWAASVALLATGAAAAQDVGGGGTALHAGAPVAGSEAVGKSGPVTSSIATPLRVSVVSIVSPRETYETYSQLMNALEVKLGRKIELVQRRTYREVNDLLAGGQLEVAFLCTGSWLDLRERAPGAAAVIAMPLAMGRTTYQSLIIVPADSAARTIDDLAGKRFAFTDELSLSGRGYVLDLLRRSGRQPDSFFAATLFTHGHDRSITAVAKGQVDGAAVHSRVLEHVSAAQPLVAQRVRVIHRSPEFGASPVVVSTRVSDELRSQFVAALLSLEGDPGAAAALRTLQIDRFIVPPPGVFDSAERLREAR